MVWAGGIIFGVTSNLAKYLEYPIFRGLPVGIPTYCASEQ